MPVCLTTAHWKVLEYFFLTFQAGMLFFSGGTFLSDCLLTRRLLIWRTDVNPMATDLTGERFSSQWLHWLFWKFKSERHPQVSFLSLHTSLSDKSEKSEHFLKFMQFWIALTIFGRVWRAWCFLLLLVRTIQTGEPEHYNRPTPRPRCLLGCLLRCGHGLAAIAEWPGQSGNCGTSRLQSCKGGHDGQYWGIAPRRVFIFLFKPRRESDQIHSCCSSDVESAHEHPRKLQHCDLLWLVLYSGVTSVQSRPVCLQPEVKRWAMPFMTIRSPCLLCATGAGQVKLRDVEKCLLFRDIALQ